MIKADIAHFGSDKILDLNTATKKVMEFKKADKTVGLCNGGFDLMHAGHIKHFESAKKICDCLIVAVTSDKFVTARKGSGRPVFSGALRAYSVAGVRYVDYVIISNFERATDLIKKLKPSYYIKGPDFVGKTTPGITSEREAIKAVGGEIKYTNDPKLSTTNVIKYIREKAKGGKILLGIDRDGTLIENIAFLGKERNWQEQVKLKKNVIDLLSYIQTKYDAVKIVISNQQGVARGYFGTKTVEAVNNYIDGLLKAKGIIINNWQYCPDADVKYASRKALEGVQFDRRFIKNKTERKPGTGMLMKALRELRINISEFDKAVIIGDSEDDMLLAKNINGAFIYVHNKSYERMRIEFDKAV